MPRNSLADETTKTNGIVDFEHDGFKVVRDDLLDGGTKTPYKLQESDVIDKTN